MAVQFVIGRCGTGKTSHQLARIVDQLKADPLGPPIYWILPKQATFQAERQLVSAPGIRGSCRVHVVSFERLGQEILTECGGIAIPEITQLGRQMILGHLLRRHKNDLRFFSAVAHQSGLPKLLDATFVELDRFGHDVEAISALLAEPDDSGNPQHESLRNKLFDLRLLYGEYNKYLGQERLDPQRRLEQVLASVERCSFLKSATIFVDAFYEFTDYERQLLAGLGKICKHVQITALVDPASSTFRDPHSLPDELGVFFRTEMAYRNLHFTLVEKDVEIITPVVLKETRRFESPALQSIEKSLFESRPRATDEHKGVELIEAPDRRAEVDAVARKINQLLSQGHRLRDIAVLMRNLEPYQGIIDASFREHGIPYFADHRRTAAHHPLIQLVRSVFQIAQNDWPHESVITLLKSGLASVLLADADELENYVLLHGIRGSAGWAKEEPWNYSRTVTREENDLPPTEQFAIARLDKLRRDFVHQLLPFIQKLVGEKNLTVRQLVTELFELFNRFKVPAEIAKWMDQSTAANEIEQRGEHQQVWTELVELLDQLVEILGHERLSLVDFVEVLESGLESFDLALTPPTVDQVLVGPVDRTRTPAIKSVFVLGLSEGEFPKSPSEDHVLSDSERRMLRQRKIDLDPDAQRQLLDEKLLGYLAFTRASRNLFVSRPLADDSGRPINASTFWRQLREMFPKLDPQSIPRNASADPRFIGTPRQFIVALMRWARQASPATKFDDVWAALYQWLAEHEFTGNAIDMMRFRAWPALRYRNEAKLSPETVAKIFPGKLKASVTRIEIFAACPFKHFARYGLRLEPRADEEITRLDLGNCYHQILEQIVRDMLKKNFGWKELTSEPAKKIIADCAKEVGQALRGELMLSTARNQYLLQRIEKTLNRVVAGQRAAAGFGKFKPAFAELKFGTGDDDNLPPLTLRTPAGRELLLNGKIDRVDLIVDQAQVAVIDYKLTKNSLALDHVYHGLALQLLTYLLVLQANGQKLAGKKLTPVAAFYVQLVRRLESVKHPEEAASPDDPLFDLQIKPRGIFDLRAIHSLDGDLVDGASNVVQAHIKKDGQIGFRDRSDAATTQEFSAMLKHVERRLGELADDILKGVVAVSPYRLNRVTPCPTCEFRSVCRFESSINPYHSLSAMKRTDVLATLTGDSTDE